MAERRVRAGARRRRVAIGAAKVRKAEDAALTL
jgi:hypothetical protein